MVPATRYHHLLRYWDCPRALGYDLEGWEPLVPPAPTLLRGQWAHRAIQALAQGQDGRQAVEQALAAHLAVYPSKAAEATRKLAQEAQALGERWQLRYGGSLAVLGVEWSYEADCNGQRIGGTLDGLVRIDGKLAVWELKTSQYPDIRSLDISGQGDYYAWLAAQNGQQCGLLVLDLVTPEYVTRLTRPPNLRRGGHLAGELAALAGWSTDWLLEQPHPGYRCGRCPFYEPCRVRDSTGFDLRVLAGNFQRRVLVDGQEVVLGGREA